MYCQARVTAFSVEDMKRVIAFGAFDPLHAGHKDFLQQAKALGEWLLVIVARDSAILTLKGYEPFQAEAERLSAVAELESVDEARLGSPTAHHYELLRDENFDVVVLGYDQRPSEDEIRHILRDFGKDQVAVVRLKPFHPEKYKSTLIRRQHTPPE
jgi:FAD synthetase